MTLTNSTTTIQKSQILAHLKEGNSITPMEALQLFGCFRLGARIWDLRKSGHDIQVERRKFTSRGGNPGSVAMYYLKTV